MAMNTLITMAFFIFFPVNTALNETIYLEELSKLYIPYRYYENGTAAIQLNTGSAEQSSYDHVDKIMYIVGSEKINAIDISDVTDPKIVYHRHIGHFDPTDVEVCGNHVFIALDNMDDRENGRVIVFKAYDKHLATMEAVLNISVGALPDMLYPTKDCKTVVIALEGEAYSKNGVIIDPEGGVGLLRLRTPSNVADNYSYKTLRFTDFNDKWEELEKKGARFIYREHGNTFSQDLEPEYITFNQNETKAYVCLQENNAIAEVDLQTDKVLAIHPLGFKQWNISGFDASDKDGDTNIQPWPVYGMYQPDSIHTFTFGGKEYLVTANEGDSKDYTKYTAANDGFNEEVLVRQLNISDDSYVMQWARSNNVTDILSDEKLGRLRVSKVNGRNNVTGKYDALYAFGGRGFSIWDLGTMQLVYDSGSDMETKSALLHPSLFNADISKSGPILKTKDKRSDNKGPETESLAVAELRDKIIIFVGNERPGTILIYSITKNISSPKFENMYAGVSTVVGTWDEAFENRKIIFSDPEDIRYIPAWKSPNGKHMLTVAGTVSGTLTLYNIHGPGLEITSDPLEDKSEGINGSSQLQSVPVIVMIISTLVCTHQCL